MYVRRLLWKFLDARGLECPLPVVKTKLLKSDKVKVLVDNEIAIENLTNFTGVRHYQIVTGDDGDDFYAIIAKEGIDEELDFNEKSGDVVVISSKTMKNNERTWCCFNEIILSCTYKTRSIT